MNKDDPTQIFGKLDPNWAKLANDALDMWQNHLTSLANDPKAKEEMTRFIAPMSQMFVEWTNMVQNGMPGMNPHAQAGQDTAGQSDEHAKPSESTFSDGADDAGSERDAELATDEGVSGQSSYEEPVAATVDPFVTKPEPIVTIAEQSEPEPEPEPEQLINDDDDGQFGSVSVSDVLAAINAGKSEPVVPAFRADDAIHQLVITPELKSEPAAIQAARRDAPASDRSRDLAQLADRLALLERELEGMRSRKRRSEESAATQSRDDRADEPVAQTYTGTTSS